MSTIVLFKYIPWSPGGHNVIRFADQAAQREYFNSQVATVFNSVDYEPRPGADLKLPIAFNDAKEYNYLAWQDGDNSPRYYFIEGYQYLNDNPVTKLIISEDIWQNCHLKMVVNPCTVHRRHMPRWNGNTPIVYPVDEGIPRSLSLNTRVRIDDFNRGPGDGYAAVIISNKKLEDTSHPDGIYYYLTYISLAGGGTVPAPGDCEWFNPIRSDFISNWDTWGVGINTIVGCYLIPMAGNLAVYNPVATFRHDLGQIETNGGHWAVFSVKEPRYERGLATYKQDLPVGEAVKNTSPTAAFKPEYEPMVFSDNMQKIILTDSAGYQLSQIPYDLAIQATGYKVRPEVFTLNPQIRINVTTSDSWQSLTNGMEVVIPCIPVDIPQSRWLDYRAQQQSQQWSILENSIRSNYWQTAVGVATGAAAGGAMGYGYSSSFSNSSRSPGIAGAASAGFSLIQGVGSLVNAKIAATEKRDALKLNEGIIKNTPSPPIGGSNWGGLYSEGIGFLNLIGDQESINSVASLYMAYGYIIDRVMTVPLRTRYYYDFIQTSNASISGEITSDARSYLEALFDSGITIWHGETFRGFRYDLNNPEVA